MPELFIREKRVIRFVHETGRSSGESLQSQTTLAPTFVLLLHHFLPFPLAQHSIHSQRAFGTDDGYTDVRHFGYFASSASSGRMKDRRPASAAISWKENLEKRLSWKEKEQKGNARTDVAFVWRKNKNQVLHSSLTGAFVAMLG